MALPTIDDLVTATGKYVNTVPASNEFVRESVLEAVDYIDDRYPAQTTTQIVDGYAVEVTSPAGVRISLYKGEIVRLSADLFWRRQAQNGVVGVNAMDGSAIRVAQDPFAASDKRTQRWGGLGIG